MTALKARFLETASEASDLQGKVSTLLAAFKEAWEDGEQQDPHEKWRTQAAVLDSIRRGYYQGYVDFATFEVNRHHHSFSVLDVAKNEVTHEFSVIVLRKDGAVPVPLLRFAEFYDYILFRKGASRFDIASDYLEPLTAGTILGKYQHIASTENDPRTCHLVGSVTDLSNGNVMALYQEQHSLRTGLRTRNMFGKDGFASDVARDKLRGPRFKLLSRMTPMDVLSVLH